VYTALETRQANVPLVRRWYDHMFHSTAVALFHNVVQFRKCRNTVHMHQQPTYYVYRPWLNSMATYTQLQQDLGYLVTIVLGLENTGTNFWVVK